MGPDKAREELDKVLRLYRARDLLARHRGLTVRQAARVADVGSDELGLLLHERPVTYRKKARHRQ